MGLDVEVEPDDLLLRYIGDTEPFYSSDPAPGKVSGYRFMSFYLAPRPNLARVFDRSVGYANQYYEALAVAG